MKNRNRSTRLALWIVLSALGLGVQSANALVLDVRQKICSNGESYTEYTGLTGVLTERNAPFLLAVPDTNWNRKLLVYARGTGSVVKLDANGQPIFDNGFPVLGLTPLTNALPEITPAGLTISGDAEALESEIICGRKYAAISTDYQPDPRFINDGLLGWVVEDGVRDIIAATIQARSILRRSVGRPQRSLLWGRSQGSLVVLSHAEGLAGWLGLYHGFLTGCTVGAGASRSWDSAIDLAVAFDVVFADLGGWQWGTPGDVNDDVVFGSLQSDGTATGDVLPPLLDLLQNPQNIGRFEFLRLMTGSPRDGFYPFPFLGSLGFREFNWLFSGMLFATEVRADLESKARGAVGQNIDHVYALSASDRAYLNDPNGLGLGNDTIDLWLADMNASTVYTGSKAGHAYTKRFKDLSGRLKRPVLTLHTTTDGLILPSQETVYRETVAAAGKSRKLKQVFVESVGHCTFTEQEWLKALDGLEARLDSGVWPGADFFRNDPDMGLRFVNGFEPGPFPQPPGN